MGIAVVILLGLTAFEAAAFVIPRNATPDGAGGCSDAQHGKRFATTGGQK